MDFIGFGKVYKNMSPVKYSRHYVKQPTPQRKKYSVSRTIFLHIFVTFLGVATDMSSTFTEVSLEHFGIVLGMVMRAFWF